MKPSTSNRCGEGSLLKYIVSRRNTVLIELISKNYYTTTARTLFYSFQHNRYYLPTYIKYHCAYFDKKPNEEFRVLNNLLIALRSNDRSVFNTIFIIRCIIYEPRITTSAVKDRSSAVPEITRFNFEQVTAMIKNNICFMFSSRK